MTPKFFKLLMLAVCLSVISQILCDLSPESEVILGGAGAWVAVSPCPFYPEGGGQAGDTGHVTFLHEGQIIRALVKDCKKVSARL